MRKFTNSGMTLLEVIITMSILAILVGASAPYISDIMERQKLKAAGETIFADLRLAQSEAIKRNQTIFVDFKTSASDWCYGTNVGNSCDCGTPGQCQIDNIDKVVRGERFKGISLQKAKFAGNKSYTAFDPLKGFALADGVKNGSIWLKSSNGTQLAIIVNRLGRIRFCSPTMNEYSQQCTAPPSP